MAKYIMEILAYQEIEVEADSLDEAKEKAILEGIDLSNSEWETRNERKYYEKDGVWERVVD